LVNFKTESHQLWDEVDGNKREMCNRMQ
jgi:hypothetical protein